ncbi:rhomboid family intramembrane serine protease [Streptomyces cinnamoneus]|uniref:rhomboid family intramembrane serine protease n=1 Tax=Streptomyces cinnamoneus TaxID=53446 RepID=UPI0033D08FDB
MSGLSRTTVSTAATAATAEQMIAEARKAFFVMFGFLAVVWALQLANWGSDYDLARRYAVVAGEVDRLPGMLTAPFLHLSWAHIESNSGPLFVFGFLAAYRGVARFFGLTALVAVASGLAIWFFEHDGVGTVGASGLVFGYFGYVVLRGFFDRHLIDSLVGVVMGASYAYTLTLTVPGTPGISWLAHLGGLVGGVIGAWVFRDRRVPTGATPVAAAPAVPDSGPAGHPRADLHKELRDLGLL